MTQSRQMLVEVVGHEDADAVELDRLARQLRSWLVQTDVDVQLSGTGDAPLDTRATNATTIGALVVTAITSRSVLASILKVIQSYLETSKARSVKIQLGDDSLEMTGLRSDDQRVLMESFVDRHTGFQ
jgi:hypothetical protein